MLYNTVYYYIRHCIVFVCERVYLCRYVVVVIEINAFVCHMRIKYILSQFYTNRPIVSSTKLVLWGIDDHNDRVTAN